MRDRLAAWKRSMAGQNVSSTSRSAGMRSRTSTVPTARTPAPAAGVITTAGWPGTASAKNEGASAYSSRPASTSSQATPCGGRSTTPSGTVVMVSDGSRLSPTSTVAPRDKPAIQSSSASHSGPGISCAAGASGCHCRRRVPRSGQASTGSVGVPSIPASPPAPTRAKGSAAPARSGAANRSSRTPLSTTMKRRSPVKTIGPPPGSRGWSGRSSTFRFMCCESGRHRRRLAPAALRGGRAARGAPVRAR